MAFALSLALVGSGASVRAQAEPPLQCVTNVAVPPVVQSESYLAVLSEFSMNCTGGAPGVVVPTDVTLTLNTAITNPGAALLVIDGQTTYQGQAVGATSVGWANVPIMLPGSDTRVMSFANVGVNASQLFGQDPGANHAITGSVVSSSFSPTPLGILGVTTTDGPGGCASPVAIPPFAPPIVLGRSIGFNGNDYDALFNVTSLPNGSVGLNLIQVVQVPQGACTGAAAITQAGGVFRLDFRVLNLGRSYVSVWSDLTSTAPPIFEPTDVGAAGTRSEDAVALDVDLSGLAVGVAKVYPKGDVVNLSRISNGVIANPDECPSRHLHGPGGIQIDGQGPFTDPNPGGCGFGPIVTNAVPIL
jgi:hypothetical protein